LTVKSLGALLAAKIKWFSSHIVGQLLKVLNDREDIFPIIMISILEITKEKMVMLACATDIQRFSFLDKLQYFKYSLLECGC